MRLLALPLLVLISLILSNCAPAPRHTLTEEEKIADMYWLYSQFNENYAPMQYKEERNQFKFADLKAKYLETAKATKTNEEFYKVMYSFVSEFTDAHTSASLNSSPLPGRTSVAYLGFSGKRVGENFMVTSLLPTVKTSANYPIQVEDRICKVNGKSLSEIIKSELVAYRSLGHDEANLAYHMSKIFNRVSISSPMPQESDIVLTVAKNGSPKCETQITLPWIIKDMVQFTEEQAKASKAPAKKAEDTQNEFDLALLAINGKFSLIPPIFKTINRSLAGFDFRKTFAFVDDAPTLNSDILSSAFKSVASSFQNLQFEGFSDSLIGGVFASVTEELKAKRNVPATALFIPGSVTFPTYVTMEGSGDSTRMVAYMYLNTFSPEGDENSIIAEVQRTLAILQANGVKDIIVDMINNGGGSLSLGMKLAQLFSKEKIQTPDMQFKISETWMDEFEEKSLTGPSDTERELARRVFANLSEDQSMGLKISRKMSTEALMPFEIQGNKALKYQFNTVLLVNEMCASMCDIFTGMMQDNRLAMVLGTRSMGAGGNVVDHNDAPNSHLSVRQTESLIVRSSGGYIENVGIQPDVEYPVVNSAAEKYEPVRAKAIEILFNNAKQGQQKQKLASLSKTP